jgi:hypothetical protein
MSFAAAPAAEDGMVGGVHAAAAAPAHARYLDADPTRWSTLIAEDVARSDHDLFDLLSTWYWTSQALHERSLLAYPYDPRQLNPGAFAASPQQPGRCWQHLMHAHVQPVISRLERACSAPGVCTVAAVVQLLACWARIWPLPPRVPVTPLDVAVADLHCHHHRRISPLDDFPSPPKKRTRRMAEDEARLPLVRSSVAVAAASAAPVVPLAPAPSSSSPFLDRHRMEADWLRQTEGRLTREMAQLLGIPEHPQAASISSRPTYGGPMAVKEQVRLYRQLNATDTGASALCWSRRRPSVPGSGSRDLPNRASKRVKITAEEFSSPDSDASDQSSSSCSNSNGNSNSNSNGNSNSNSNSNV